MMDRALNEQPKRDHEVWLDTKPGMRERLAAVAAQSRKRRRRGDRRGGVGGGCDPPAGRPPQGGGARELPPSWLSNETHGVECRWPCEWFGWLVAPSFDDDSLSRPMHLMPEGAVAATAVSTPVAMAPVGSFGVRMGGFPTTHSALPFFLPIGVHKFTRAEVMRHPCRHPYTRARHGMAYQQQVEQTERTGRPLHRTDGRQGKMMK